MKKLILLEKIRGNRYTHGLSTHRIYGVWVGMKRRCENKKHKAFKYYGSIGIKVCDSWNSVENFIEDMYPSFKEGLTLDRKDNNKGYSKNNCRWATRKVQTRNTRLLFANNTSGYRGVSYDKSRKKWKSTITIKNNQKFIGRYNTNIEAAKAYDSYVIENNLEHTINGVL